MHLPPTGRGAIHGRLSSADCPQRSRNDISRLIELCIQAPNTLRFEIFYGLSDSDYRWVDIENAAEIWVTFQDGSD